MPRRGFGRSRIPGRPQELRKEQTSAEEAVWELLRGRRFLGLKFRRQFPVETYIVDFCCYELRLVVEIDGEVHAEPRQIAHDRNRDEYLRSRGFKVLRFSNQSILDDRAGVLRQIAAAAGGLTPDPSPIALPTDRERGAPTQQPPSIKSAGFSPSPGGREGDGRGGSGG